MSQSGKRMRNISKKLEAKKAYMPVAAFDLLKECGAVKFIESVDASINLGINPKKGDQTVRGFYQFSAWFR